jgi:hypothetical protein
MALSIFGWEVNSDRVFEYFVETNADYFNYTSGTYIFALLKSVNDTYFFGCMCGTSLECDEMKSLIEYHEWYGCEQLRAYRNRFGGVGEPKLFIINNLK